MDETKTEQKTEQEQTQLKQIPSFRILQQSVIKGKQSLHEVGVVWKKINKHNKVFYSIQIGKLSLLMFDNDRAKQSEREEG